MSILSYNVKLKVSSKEDEARILDVLKAQRGAYNFASEKFFGSKIYSIVDIHNKTYYPFREKHPNVPSQIVIKAEQDCLASYRTAKQNKHKLTKPIEKKRLSLRLDKRLSTYKNGILKFTVLEGKRVEVGFCLYPKAEGLLARYLFIDPLIFERNGELYAVLSFNIQDSPILNKVSLGVDLGKRNIAATSEGKIIRGTKFNRRKRQIRFLKRKLQTSGTKSAKRHLKKVRRKERNFTKNYTHHVANELLKTTANVLVLEDLTKIKAKKNKFQNRNSISQVPFYLLRSILDYKAQLYNKETQLINPFMTSQNDYRGKKNGKRLGAMYKTSDGLTFHSDLNAANNIALKSKHPCFLVDPVNSFIRQAEVTRPNAGLNLPVLLSQGQVSCKPRISIRGQ